MDSLKLTATKKSCFTIKIGEVEEMFVVVSQWQGLLQLRLCSGPGELIVAPAADSAMFSTMFKNLFAAPEGQTEELYVIKCSPNLMERLTASTHKAAAPEVSPSGIDPK